MRYVLVDLYSIMHFERSVSVVCMQPARSLLGRVDRDETAAPWVMYVSFLSSLRHFVYSETCTADTTSTYEPTESVRRTRPLAAVWQRGRGGSNFVIYEKKNTF